MVSLPTSGRGRGRPKKAGQSGVRIDPRTEEFFSVDEREGGPIDPLSNFDEIYEAIFFLSNKVQSYDKQDKSAIKLTKYERNVIQSSMDNYELFKYLKQFSATFNSGINVGTYMYANKYSESQKIGQSESENQNKFEDQKTSNQYSNLWD